MIITYDQSKDATNLVKHGISLAAANGLEWETLLAKQDVRRDYTEARFIGYAIMKDRLYCVVFTDRGEQRRIISLRKANVREVKAYAKND